MPCASVITVTVGAVMSGSTSTLMRAALSAPPASSSTASASTATRFRIDQRMRAFHMAAAYWCWWDSSEPATDER
jgi:hypothetical protein